MPVVLPSELVNKIIMMRGTHPTAELMREEIRFYEQCKTNFIEDFKNGYRISFNGSLHKLMVTFGMTDHTEESFMRWFFLT